MDKKYIENLIAIPIALIGIALFQFCVRTGSDRPDSAPQAVAPPPAPECVLAGGNLYANVQLYEDPGCSQPLAIVYGGGTVDGDRIVVLDYPDGSRDPKLRSAVIQQTYVMTDDPALEAKLWRDLN